MASLVLASTVACPALSATAPTVRVTPRAPAVIMPPDSLPESLAAARSFLRQRLLTTPLGTKQREDIAWVLRLDERYGGPGQPVGRRATVARTLRVNAWWFQHFSSPNQRVVLRDSDGIISTYRERHGFMVNPVATIGRWRGLNDDVPVATLARLIKRMGVLKEYRGNQVMVWEYFDVADRPKLMRPGVSGMAQARGALLMVQAYRQTGDPGYARAVLSTLRSFETPVNRGGVRSTVRVGNHPAGPWYVERAYPGENPWKGAALNGFMVSLLDLERVAEVLGRPPLPPSRTGSTYDPQPAELAVGRELTGNLVDAGIQTLRRYLPQHDTGSWSLYGLLTPGFKWKERVADLNYHCYHITLLDRLERDFPGQSFGRVAVRWKRYAREQEVSCPTSTSAPALPTESQPSP